VRVDGTRCTEDLNIRSAIKNYQSHNAAATAISARPREALDIHDVKWSHGTYRSYVATAATSGKIVLYDLGRAGMELARLHEHHRQVHKIAFNPHQGHILLSGSQDATARLWDLRDLRREAMICPSRERFLGQSEGVRTIKWSPTEGFEFAFGTDNGVIQRWDYRHNRGPKLKLTAHDKTVTCIDWHPDGKHLLSASTDRNVKIWDFSSDRRRQKPAWSIRTPYPIYQARWRPPIWADGAWHTTQLATAYDREHPVVNIWDFRRPHLPFRELARYSTAPTDMLWHSRDLLWTVGREGIFTQTDVHFAPKVVERRNMQSFALAPNGEVHAFTQKRPDARRTKTRGLEDAFTSEATKKRNSPEKGSLSRSSADDSVDDSFLSSSYGRRHHARSASHRSAKSLGGTPPSAEESKKVMMLETILEKDTNPNLPNQIAFRGMVPSPFNLQIFTYLAQKYKALPPIEELTVDLLQNVQRIFDQNAQYSIKAAGHRVAFSWQLLGYALTQILMERAEANRAQRLQSHHKEKRMLGTPPIQRIRGSDDTGVTAGLNPAIRALQDQASPAGRSAATSHTATPVAKPITPAAAHASADVSNAETRGSTRLADPDQDETLKLPDSLLHVSPMPLQSVQSSGPSFDGSRSTFDSDSSYAAQPDQNGHHVRNWKPIQRTPLNLDPTESSTSNAPPPMNRHNSDESFAFFPASADSHPGMSMASSFASARSRGESGWSKWDDTESQAESSLGNSSSAISGQDSSGRRPSFRRVSRHQYCGDPVY
jgi:WD repeat-containing protein 24